MHKEDQAFEERLNNEYDLRGRAKLATILSGILFLCFLGLDAIYTPQFIREFVIIRLSVFVLHMVLLILYTKTHTNRGYARLGAALVLLDAVGIALMIQILGGFLTSYYQGLTLIIIGMVVVIPLAFKDTVILYAIIWASYAVPSFLRLPGEPNDWRYVINNLFFLTSIIVIGTFGSYIMDSIRRRELRGRIQLEEATSQLQESNEKLKTLDELKTQFFANINHELRTPLTLMLAPLHMLLTGKMGKISASQKDTLETMQRNGYMLLKLINNLLDLTKLEEGKMRLKIKNVDFLDYVSSLLSTVKPMAEQKNIKLYFQHPPDRIDLSIDPDQFEKVILNLLSNALKFTPENGKVTVYVEEKKHTVSLIVEDTGIGIPSNMLDSIFDRFSQVDGSKSRSHEGTGIGLSLAREIVDLHGGAIKARSNPGQGSSFMVEIIKGHKHYSSDVLDRREVDTPVGLKRRDSDVDGPKVQDIVTDYRRLQLVDLEKVDISSEAAAAHAAHDIQLLVIDDSTEVLKLMKMLLADEFDLEMAESAEEGLRILKKKSPDLVLCDVMMPGMDGHSFCRKVKADETLKHIPVILVTARTGADMVAEGIESGADDYVSKPFDSVELKARIHSLLRIREVESELALANQNLKMRTSDLMDQQRSLFLSTVKSLVSAIDAKDEYTRYHSTRVTEYSLKIARSMNLSEKEQEDLELASLLHDIGKIAVPERILNKPGPLTDEEFAYIKEHPARGESILSPMVELNEIARVVRAHHEHYNGTGYPDGLKGLGIPLGARIMSVADAYDSITSERQYRKAASHRVAVKEITRCSATQFDPNVVQHFLEICSSFIEKLPG